MKQQGNSTLGMVMMLLLLGGVTLHATRQQLSRSLVLVADTQHYFQHHSQAQAALRWGVQQRWSPADGWQCQQWTTAQWQSCLLRREEGYGLLSARQAGSALWLYRWVELRGARVLALPHGWIDFCPLAASEACPGEAVTAGI